MIATVRAAERRAATFFLAGAVVVLAAESSAREQEREELLRRVAANVDRFQTDFARLIGRESYRQEQRQVGRPVRVRQLTSEVFFFGSTDAGVALTVRNVQVVDGRRVADTGESIERALGMSDGRRPGVLRALADANARYNLGAIRRNFNEPTLALLFASTANQARFSFRERGSEEKDDRVLVRIDFSEVVRPTFVRDGASAGDIPASGSLWVDEGGTIWRTRLVLDNPRRTYAEVDVTYGLDGRLGLMVPLSMTEEYRSVGGGPARQVSIGGQATYTDYRRFETTGRIVTP